MVKFNRVEYHIEVDEEFKFCLCAWVYEPKAPFLIATIPMCREGRYFFPWIAPLTLDPYL